MSEKVLDVNYFISWRRCRVDIELCLKEGDPIVITVSTNGHDAVANNLNETDKKFVIKAGNWFTVVSLGRSSCVHILPPKICEEYAPDGWFPTPRKSDDT